MRKLKKYLAIFLAVILTVYQLPVRAIASGTAYAADNEQGFLSLPSGASGSYAFKTLSAADYSTGQEVMLASSGEEDGSGLQYDLSLKIELNEMMRSLAVQADINSLGQEASGGLLIVTLYEKENGIPKLVDLFTAEVKSGILADTLDTPEASGELSFTGNDPEKLAVSAVICRSLDEPLPVSAPVSYDAYGFIIVPVSVSTLEATEVGKTSAVLRGKVAVADGVELNTADFGFVLGSLEDDNLKSIADYVSNDGTSDNEVNEIELIADSISDDGTFTKTVTGLSEDKQYYFAAISNKHELSFGDTKDFTTLTDLPKVKTGDFTIISSIEVRLTGSVEDSKGFEIIESGFLFGLTPELPDKIEKQYGTQGKIIAEPGVRPGSTIYYRAYAITSAGTGYGEIMSLTVPPEAPAFSNSPNSSVVIDPETWTVTFTGRLATDGGDSDLTCGFRYKLTGSEDWIYVSAEASGTPPVFSAQLSGKDVFPPGVYDIEAYASNSAGITTYTWRDFRTPLLPQVTTSFDRASVTESKAVLTGKIEGLYSDCIQRGFEYREAASDIWLEAGIEEGPFTDAGFTFTLDGLLPNTEYVFRAKVTNYAGTVTGPEITFTTLHSSSAKETAYRMKIDGAGASEVIGILKGNFKVSVEEAITCMLFAGFSPDETISACMSAAYPGISDYKVVCQVLKSQEVKLPMVANILRTCYDDVFNGFGVEKDLKAALTEIGFATDDIIKELKEHYNIRLTNISSTLGLTTEEAYKALIRIYGAQSFANMYWEDYEAASSPLFYMKNLAEILQSYTELDIVSIVNIIKNVYPALTPSDLSNSIKSLYSIEEVARTLDKVFSADELTIAQCLYANYTDKDAVDSLLLQEYVFDAETMVRILWRTYDRDMLPGKVALYLESQFNIAAATEAAKLMYAANSQEGNKYSMHLFMQILKDSYNVDNANDFIDILKALNLPAADIGVYIDAFSEICPDGETWREVWLPEYKNHGFSSLDAGRWYQRTLYGNDYGLAALNLKTAAGYSLAEIALMLKEIYNLSSEDTYNTLAYYKDIGSPEEITEVVNNLYQVNSIETEIQKLKDAEKTATEIVQHIKNKFGKSDPLEITGYFIPLGYTMEDVLTALAKNFNTLSDMPFMRMLLQVLSEKYSQQPMDQIELILNLFEGNKHTFQHAKDCITMLNNLGFDLEDIAKVLKNHYSMLAFDAGRLLINMKNYGVPFNRSEVIDAVEKVYGESFMRLTVENYRNQSYEAGVVARILDEDYGIDTPEAAARCLKDAGYSMAEVLEGIYKYYLHTSTSDAYKINVQKRICENVYPEVQHPIKMILESMGHKYLAAPILVLPGAGFSSAQIIRILKDEYGLSAPAAMNLLKENNFKVTVEPIQGVWGSNAILEFIEDRIENGDSLEEIYKLLYEFFSVTELESLHSYLADAGYSLVDFMDLMYRKQQFSNSAILEALESAYEDLDFILEYLDHLRGSGQGIAQCYKYLRNEFNIRDPQKAVDYLKKAGFGLIEIIDQFTFNKDYDSISILQALQDAYEELDVILEFTKNSRNVKGRSVAQTFTWLHDEFGIRDIKQIAQYLKGAGYTDDAILSGLESCVRYQAIAILKALYGSESAVELLNKLKLSGVRNYYSVGDLITGLLAEFSDMMYKEALLAIKEVEYTDEYTLQHIGDWLYFAAGNGTIPKVQRDDIAGILGTKVF